MPPVVIAAAVGMAAAGAAAAGWIATSTALIIAIGASVAGALLTKTPSFGGYTSQQDRKQVLRSSTAPQAHIYGRTVTSGVMFFAEEEKGDYDKAWIHIAIALCGHPIDGVEAVYLGDELISTYGEHADYEVHSDRQTADPFMLSKCASWKDDMIGKGITWARVSLKFDSEKFPSGIPNIKFQIRGKQVYDPRNGATAWTDNAALCIRDYYASYLSVDADDINDQQFIQAANISDQTVINEDNKVRKRYTINGIFDVNEAQSAVLDDLHLACAGESTFMAGQHGILVGAYYGPATMDLVEDQIISDVQIVPEASFGDKLNIVTGTFLDPESQYAETEFPQVRVEQYVDEDGNEFVDDVKYRFVSNVHQAQQLAQIKMNRTRIGRSVKLTMNLSGYMYRPGYYVNLTIEPLGIKNQEFRITEWSINATKGVDVTLRQETSEVWLDIIGQPIERPDITDFPSQGIAAPRNLEFSVVEIGEVVQGRLTWINGAADVNYNIVIIRQNGKIIQSIQVPGETVDITGLPRGSYEMAVVSVNYMGQKSPEAMIVAEIHAPNTPTSVHMDNGYFEYTLKPQSSDLATVSVQYDFWTSGTTKLANTSDATVTTKATRRGIGKTWTESSDKNDRVYYWYIRAINAFGTSPFIEFAAHFQMEPGKAIDFIEENLKETETYKKLDEDIEDISGAVSDAQAAVDEAQSAVENIKGQITGITTDVDKLASDVLQAQSDIEKNSSVLTDNTKDLQQQAKDIAKNAKDILKNAGDIAQEALDRAGAISQEATNRTNEIAASAQASADALLNEKTEREAAIDNTKTLIQTNYDSLASTLAQISAGTGQQFDSAKIYYFQDSAEGWTLDDAGNTAMIINKDNWMVTPSGNSNYDARSPNGMGVNSRSYKFVKMRIKKVGKPNWNGYLYWIGDKESGWDNSRRMAIPEPDYNDAGVSTLDINDIQWSGSETIRRIRISLCSNQTADNYYMVDFIAVGRPTPGASVAALEAERTARVNGDAAEAKERKTLAAQLRGGYDGNDPSKLTSGLIYEQNKVRVSAEQAIASSVDALNTEYDKNKAAVQTSLDTLTSKTNANASAITGIETKLDSKANASAVNALGTKVSDVEGKLQSQSSSITTLNNSVKVLKNQTSNAWLDGSFESYDANTHLYGNDGKCVVITSQKYAGDKALKVSRGVNETGNSDKILNVRSTIRENSYYKFELYAMMPADQQPSNGWSCIVGFNLRNSAGSNSWPSAIKIDEASLKAGGGRGKWVKFTGVLNAGSGRTQAAVWISPRGAIGSGTPGYTLYIDEFSIIDITEARAAQTTADAAASGVNSLTTRVDNTEGELTTQGTALTGLTNNLDTMSKELDKKANSSALDTLSSRVTDAEGKIDAQADSIVSLNTDLTLLDNTGSAMSSTPGNMLTNASFENMLKRWTVTGTKNKAESISAVSPHTGSRILRMSADANPVYINQQVQFRAGHTYKYGGFVRAQSGTTLRDANNNKLRIGDATTGSLLDNVLVNPSDLPTGSTYKEYYGTYTPKNDVIVSFGVYSSLKAGNQYWDDVYVIDITNEKLTNANASAITNLTTRVSDAEGTISSQSGQITELKNNINTMSGDIKKKADVSAVNALQTQVNTQGGTIDSQGSSITDINTKLSNVDKKLNAKADVGALQSLSGRVSANELAIEAESAAITQLSSNLMTGNLIFNGDVSTNSVAWQSMGAGSSWTWDSKDKALLTTSASIRLGNVTKIPVEPGMQLTIQFDTRATANGLTTGSQVDLVGFISNINDSTNWVVNAEGWLKGITTAYTTKRATVTIPDNFTGSYVYLRFAQGGWTPNTVRIYIKNIVVTSSLGVNKKASASAVESLTTRVNTISGKVESVSQSATELSNKLSGMQADLNINSLMPGNMFANHSFENDLNGWSGGDRAVFSTIKAQSPHSGTSILVATKGQSSIVQSIALVKDHTYKLGVFVRRNAGATINSQGNHKLRIGDSALRKEVPILNADVPTGSTFKEISSTWKCVADGKYDVSLMSSLTVGDYYFDDIFIIDITDQLKIDANATATSDLVSRVTNAEGTISAQTGLITNLRTDLNTANKTLKSKADQSAVNTLSGRVDKTESGIQSANTDITSLTAAVNAVKTGAEDLIPNPTFDPAYYQMNYQVVDSTIDKTVPAGAPFRYVAKIAARDHIPSMPNIPVREGDVFELTAMVAVKSGGKANFQFYVGTALSISGGINAAANGGAVTPANGANWTKTTWRVTVTAAMATRGYLRPFLQINQSSPFETVWYVTDWHMRNITNVKAADDKASAAASAVNSLGNTVKQQDKVIEAISGRTTTLENGLNAVNTTLKSKADSSALNALTSAVKSNGDTIESQGTQLTTLNQRISSYENDTDAGKSQPANMLANGSFERDLANWTNSSWEVYAAQSPHGGKKILRMIKSGIAICDQTVTLKSGRTYRFGVFARRNGNVVISNAGNTKLSIRNSADVEVASAPMTLSNVPSSSNWAEITKEWKATADGTYKISLRATISAGEFYLDDAYVIDITDAIGVAANASAVGGLTSRVSNAEGIISSHTSSITSLNGSVSNITKTLNSKASSSTVQELTNKVNTQGDKITSQGNAINNINTSLKTTNENLDASNADADSKVFGNLLVNGSFERGLVGYKGATAQSTVQTLQKPHGGKKALVLTPATTSASVYQNVTVKKGRLYEIAAWTKVTGGTKMNTNTLGNNKLRIGHTNGTAIGDKQLDPATISTSDWQQTSFRWRATIDGEITVGIMWSLASGIQYYDDFTFIDITDREDIAANATAYSKLEGRVSNAEGKIISQGNQITNLGGDLTVVQGGLKTKADASALNALNTKVESQGKTLTSQSQAITNLSNSLVIGNLILNGDLKTNADNWQSSGSGSSFSYNETDKALRSGGNSIRVANKSAIAVEPGMKLTISFEVKASVSGVKATSDSVGFVTSPSFNPATWTVAQEGWLANVTTSFNTRTYTLTVPTTYTGRFLYLRFACGGGTPSNFAISIRNVVVTAKTGVSGKADASALNSLTTRVGNAEGTLKSVVSDVGKLTTRVGTAESGLTRVNETVASLGLAQTTTFQQLRSMIGDNSASIITTNKVITDLDSSTAKSVSTLTSKYNNVNASVQQTSSAIAGINNKLAAQWGVKIETNSNNVKVVAGIQLGIDATGSSAFLVKADTFGVYNPNASGGMNLAFVVKGSQTYIRETFIENGTISNAKIGNEIRSNAYTGGSVGWRIAKDGACEFNNVVVRGEIHAVQGRFSFNGGNGVTINGNGIRVDIDGGGYIILGKW